jgi:hypothetical protein
VGRKEKEIAARFDAMIEAILDENRYTAWLLLAVSATNPE